MKTKTLQVTSRKPLSFYPYFLCLIFSLLTLNSFSQSVGIGETSFTPDPSAILDVSSTTQGQLMPRMTSAQRDAIASPATGLFIFNITNNCFEAYVDGAWNTVSCPAACTPPAAPVASAATNLNCYSFTANWSASTGATAYYLDLSTNSGFSSFVTGYKNINVGNVTSYPLTGLTPSTTYYYRLRAATACAGSNSGNITTTTTSLLTSGPSTGTHVPSPTQIVWNWNTVSEATGYKWSTTNDYNAASDNGASTTKTQTGLTCNTSNSIYVWAYNACSHSASTTLTQTTSLCCSPGTVLDGTLQKATSCNAPYTIVSFTYSSSPGSTTWTVPSGVTSVEYLIVAGGGGGGGYAGGGGGAGGFLTATNFSVTPGSSYKVIVGSGGAGGVNSGSYPPGTSGNNSIFATITATGGGGGGSYSYGDAPATGNGKPGGSGGGGGWEQLSSPTHSGGTATASPVQGNNGGIGGNLATNYGSGSGGGAGAAGTLGSNSAGSAGGIGLSSSITGSAVYYAGGGGGGTYSGTPSPTSLGGGGSGGNNSVAATSGSPNTGGGGGSCGGSSSNGTKGGDGGSGIVIIRYVTP